MSPARPICRFEVRLTPLFLGVPGLAENSGGISTIDEADTLLVTQFSGLRVEQIHNEGRIGNLLLSMHDEILDSVDLEAFEQALWIGFWRPGEELAEAILWAQANVVEDFESTAPSVIELVAADPYAGRARTHYIRRGDVALNIDPERGRLPAHAFSTETILDAARNIPAQQNRFVPALALGEAAYAAFSEPSYEPDHEVAGDSDAPFIEFERGQEVIDLHQQVVVSTAGPDIDVLPSWWFPAQRYATVNLYAPASSTVNADQLGRNLDPVDVEDPQDGEVVLECGIGRDNCTRIRREPGQPKTHVHWLDASRRYRVTRADAASSARIGVFGEFNVADFTIERPSRTKPADLSALLALAENRVRAYGKPPKHMIVTLRKPDAPGMYLYGHPDWVGSGPPGVEQIGGHFYMGDYVRVRAKKGKRFFSELGRIVKIIFTQDGPNDLPDTQIELIPAVGGTPGEDIDSPLSDASPVVVITAPASGAEVSGAAVAIAATATDDHGVASVQVRIDGAPLSGGFFTAAPYEATWDSTTTYDGEHTVAVTAIDTGGNSTTASIVVTTANGVDPPPPSGAYPTRLHAGASQLEDAANVPVGVMTGGNVHCLPDYTPDLAFLQDIRAKATTDEAFVRVVCVWSHWEPSPGTVNETQRNSLDLLLTRLEAAGLYAELELHLNVGAVPGWTSGVDETAKYVNHGQFITEYLATRYGANPVVMGFGLNEIPLGDATIRNGNNAIPYLEGVQRDMIDWFRGAGAPDWIGFVTLGYSNQSPYLAGSRTDASAVAYDGVGGNVVMDGHMYLAGCNSADPAYDGRQANGHVYPTYQGGTAIWQISNYPITFVDTATHRAQMLAFMQPLIDFCAAAGIPLMWGELGWAHNNVGGEAAWWDAICEILAAHPPAMLAQWILSKNVPPKEYWPSTPGGTWRTGVVRLLDPGAW